MAIMPKKPVGRSLRYERTSGGFAHIDNVGGAMARLGLTVISGRLSWYLARHQPGLVFEWDGGSGG